jgi:hypothetical protein
MASEAGPSTSVRPKQKRGKKSVPPKKVNAKKAHKLEAKNKISSLERAAMEFVCDAYILVLTLVNSYTLKGSSRGIGIVRRLANIRYDEARYVQKVLSRTESEGTA